jgi:hypothetical protein
VSKISALTTHPFWGNLGTFGPWAAHQIFGAYEQNFVRIGILAAADTVLYAALLYRLDAGSQIRHLDSLIIVLIAGLQAVKQHAPQLTISVNSCQRSDNSMAPYYIMTSYAKQLAIGSSPSKLVISLHIGRLCVTVCLNESCSGPSPSPRSGRCIPCSHLYPSFSSPRHSQAILDTLAQLKSTHRKPTLRVQQLPRTSVVPTKRSPSLIDSFRVPLWI